MRKAIGACPLQPGKLYGYNSSSVDYEDGLLGAEYVGWNATHNEEVIYRVVKNGSSGTMVSQTLVKFSTAAGEYGKVISGVAGAAERGFPVAGGYPSSGIPANELFLIVVGGPADVLTPASGMVLIDEGDVLVGAASGRITLQDLTGATAVLGAQLQNRIGRALTALTTNNTSTALAVRVTWM